jgi:predicted dinucleotide-binding enzyme
MWWALPSSYKPGAQAVTHLVSASAGAVVSAFVRVPTDTLKHRVQAYVLPDVFRARTPNSDPARTCMLPF